MSWLTLMGEPLAVVVDRINILGRGMDEGSDE